MKTKSCGGFLTGALVETRWTGKEAAHTPKSARRTAAGKAGRMLLSLCLPEL